MVVSGGFKAFTVLELIICFQRLVTAEGKAITASPAGNSDLWWGLRAAGHNFGIVLSLTMKAYPQINNGMHWMGLSIFTPDKILAIVEAINGLDWSQGIVVNIFYTAAPPDMKVCTLSADTQILHHCSLSLSFSNGHNSQRSLSQRGTQEQKNQH